MRQVPRYIMIGNGRLAAHFRHYFDGLGIQYTQWSRTNTQDNLDQQLKHATHALVLISDTHIHDFVHHRQFNCRPGEGA